MSSANGNNITESFNSIRDDDDLCVACGEHGCAYKSNLCKVCQKGMGIKKISARRLAQLGWTAEESFDAERGMCKTCGEHEESGYCDSCDSCYGICECDDCDCPKCDGIHIGWEMCATCDNYTNPEVRSSGSAWAPVYYICNTCNKPICEDCDNTDINEKIFCDNCVTGEDAEEKELGFEAESGQMCEVCYGNDDLPYDSDHFTKCGRCKKSVCMDCDGEMEYHPDWFKVCGECDTILENVSIHGAESFEAEEMCDGCGGLFSTDLLSPDEYAMGGVCVKCKDGKNAESFNAEESSKGLPWMTFALIGLGAFVASRIKTVNFKAHDDCGCGCSGAGGCGDEKKADEGHYPNTYDPVQDFLPRYRYPEDSDWSNSYNPTDPYRPLDYQTVQTDTRVTADRM